MTVCRGFSNQWPPVKSHCWLGCAIPIRHAEGCIMLHASSPWSHWPRTLVDGTFCTVCSALSHNAKSSWGVAEILTNSNHTPLLRAHTRARPRLDRRQQPLNGLVSRLCVVPGPVQVCRHSVRPACAHVASCACLPPVRATSSAEEGSTRRSLRSKVGRPELALAHLASLLPLRTCKAPKPSARLCRTAEHGRHHSCIRITLPISSRGLSPLRVIPLQPCSEPLQY